MFFCHDYVDDYGDNDDDDGDDVSKRNKPEHSSLCKLEPVELVCELDLFDQFLVRMTIMMMFSGWISLNVVCVAGCPSFHLAEKVL